MRGWQLEDFEIISYSGPSTKKTDNGWSGYPFIDRYSENRIRVQNPFCKRIRHKRKNEKPRIRIQLREFSRDFCDSVWLCEMYNAIFLNLSSYLLSLWEKNMLFPDPDSESFRFFFRTGSFHRISSATGERENSCICIVRVGSCSGSVFFDRFP